MRVWRRHHGASLVAQILVRDEVKGYDVCVWTVTEEHMAITQRTAGGTLDGAKAAADDLVRRAFQHKCDWKGCADWLQWV